MLLEKLKVYARRFIALACLILNILCCWFWWESYKATVNWSKRFDLFPLPFYATYWPHWFIVDFCISVIVLCSFILALLAIK